MTTNLSKPASFTAGALLYNEILAVKNLLLNQDFVKLMDKEARDNQLLRIKTETARMRVTTEIKKRVKSTAEEVWRVLPTLEEGEQRLLLFYVVLKTYPLAKDFQFEVVLKKWRNLQHQVDKYDLQMRMDEISSRDDEIAAWTDSTKNKTLTQFVRMLREAGLMKKDRLIKPETANSTFWSYFIKWNEIWFLDACFFSKTERDKYL